MDNLNAYKWLDAVEMRDLTSQEKKVLKSEASFNKQINHKLMDLLEQI